MPRGWHDRASHGPGTLWLPALLLITAVGAVLRIVWLGGAPPALHFDEAVYGLMARQIGPGYWPIFFSGYTGREPLYMYLMAAVFRLLGSTAVTLRLTSALVGIFTIPLVYLLGAEVHSRRVGLLAATVMAGNYWHLSLSRNGYPNILIPPLECLAVILLWRGYRDRKRFVMGLGGLFVGLVLYTYLAARLFPITLILFFLYVLIVDTRRFADRLGGLVLAAGAALAVFAPLGLHFLRNPHDFVERASQVLVFESAGTWADWLRIMASNLVSNLAGLFVSGDPRPIFNLPGKPVFTLFMAGFFLLGLAVALRHGKRPEYGLWPIWVLGMCLPAVLTDDVMPQSQRMSGIMPAIFVLTALGLDRAFTWLRSPRRPQVAQWAPWLIGGFLLAEALWTGYVYFYRWAREPMNYYHFHAPYQVAAEDAAPRLAAGDTAVIIAEHYLHPTALYTAPALRDALWLVAHKTLVVPARAQGEVFYYWPHDPFIAQPFIDARLPSLAEPVRTYLDPSGKAALDVYRLSDAAREASAMDAVASLGEIEILQWTLPAWAPRDAVLPVEVVWRVRETTSAGRIFSVHLLDASGYRWSQHTDLGFMPEQWQPGDTVYQLFEVPLPEGIPAGDYQVAFLMGDAGAAPFAIHVADRASGFQLDLGAVRLTPEGATVRAPQRGPALGDALCLLERPSYADGVLSAPDLDVAVTWQAAQVPNADLAVALTVMDAGGAQVHQAQYPVAGDYDTRQWTRGEVVRSRYRLALPDLPAVRYALSLSVVGAEGTVGLGTLIAETSLRSYQIPPLEHAVGARFGQQVDLLGYALESATLRPGGSVALTLYWQAQAEITADAKVFVHLVDAGGRLCAQVDAVPVDGQRPTTSWHAREVITDRYAIALPADMPQGDYTLYVGMYDAVTLQRWPVSMTGSGAAEGNRVVTDDRLAIAECSVGH